MVYVLNLKNEPLMPTMRHSYVRRILKAGKAEVVKRTPFTIRLLKSSKAFKQDITLGVDCGSKYVGLSATTNRKELFSAEVILRTDIVKLLADKRGCRRIRRNRLRYRAARFNNRVSRNTLAPSIRQRISTHLTLVKKICALLPISSIKVEVAAFDTQKIKNDSVNGTQYQQGEQLGFWNVREYVLFRDRHTCQHCSGKRNDKILNIHHIESRKTGGNSPSNLITLCNSCHKDHHCKGLKLKIKRSTSLRDAAVMSIMKWRLLDELRTLFANVEHTYGYITKHIRIKSGLAKSHCIDARCITGNPLATPLNKTYQMRCVRRHNRQTHKKNILKGGKLKLNQSPYLVNGFRLFDKVSFKGIECFIFGRRQSGAFDIRLLDGTKIHAGINCKKLVLLEKRQTFLITI